ncbi:MAG: FAD-binding oxidoreductase [Neisseriaceae bacterium]|nr:FAD-binding oxidoreductase [Neisseriaceae bacterium]MBP6863567.1 FAD-binding oxidoreductase [Neisseriaceae bacterium]
MLSFAYQNHPASFYANSRSEALYCASFRGHEHADVCVIGGGFTGISTALNLARAGKKVILLEGAHIGFGASGRNGGQVISGYACELDEFERQLGTSAAQTFWDWSLEAVDIVDAHVRDYAIDCDWTRGYATVSVKPKQQQALQAYVTKMQQQYGYDGHQVWDKHQLQQHLNSGRYYGGIYDQTSGHLHPLNYCLGLARAAISHGACLYENSPVTDVYAQGDGAIVRTPHGQVNATDVVFASNAFVSQLKSPQAQALSKKILPVGTYMIATEPLGDRAARLIDNHMAVCDSQFVLDYYRLSADTRLLFGGKVSYSGRPPRQLAQSMRADMLRVFPQLRNVAIDYAWGGHVDVTMNRAPHWGRLAPNVYFAQGFSGHGVALTGLAGKVIAEAILGDDSRLRHFEAIKHRDFPGGRWLRMPTQVAAMGYYRLRDWL